MKKIIKKSITIFTGILLIMAIVMLVTAVIARFNNKTPSLFGYTFHYVVTASMEPEIKVGDFVVAKKADINDVKLGDYVVFVSPDPSLRGITIIHSVVEINEDADGRLLTTSGIKEGSSPDLYPVREIISIYKHKSAFLGNVVNFFTKIRNLVFLAILFTAVMIMIKQGVNIAKGIKENKEKGEDEE